LLPRSSGSIGNLQIGVAWQYQRTLAGDHRRPHCSDMNKRILATFLWFLMGWTVGAIATFFFGLPEGLNIGLAALGAAAVWWDPTHLLWPQGGRIMKAVPTRQIVGGRRLSTD
jgi:hypothetical protein